MSTYLTGPLHIRSIATMFAPTDPRRAALTASLDRVDVADFGRTKSTTKGDGWYDGDENRALRDAIVGRYANLKPLERSAAQALFGVLDMERTESESRDLTTAALTQKVLQPELAFDNLTPEIMDGRDVTVELRDLLQRLATTDPGQADGVTRVKTTELLRAADDLWLSGDERRLVKAALKRVVNPSVELTNTTSQDGSVRTRMVLTPQLYQGPSVELGKAVAVHAPPGSTVVLAAQSVVVPASGEVQLTLPTRTYGEPFPEGFVFAPVGDTEEPKLLHRFDISAAPDLIWLKDTSLLRELGDTW